MVQKSSRGSQVKYLVFVSLIGLFLVAMLTLHPPKIHENLPWRKPLVGSVFGVICIFGIVAVFSPEWCSRFLDLRQKEISRSLPNLDDFASNGTSFTVRGHHPDCGNFSAHVIRIGYKLFCVACSGLLLGGFLALAGILLWFFGVWPIGRISSLIVWIGVLGVGFGLFQFKSRGFVRLFLNMIFVLGTFFILTGIDELVHSLAIDLFLVASTVFWLLTRVSLSEWDHERICHTCKVATCKHAGKHALGARMHENY